MAGMGGKWLAEKSGLGKMITREVNGYPDPTQHWAVLVGDYVHELWMDEHLDIIYINEVLKREEWTTFEVGKTRFTDEALRQAGIYPPLCDEEEELIVHRRNGNPQHARQKTGIQHYLQQLPELCRAITRRYSNRQTRRVCDKFCGVSESYRERSDQRSF